jgi:hypothetical protein
LLEIRQTICWIWSKEEANMKSVSRSSKNVASIAVATSMVFAALVAVGPMIAVAPPLQGTLTVTFYDLAPNTNTFPGDMNITMIWLEMSASGGDVRVDSIEFEITGSGITASEITSVALWEDYDPSWYADPNKDQYQAQDFFECELDMSSVNNLVFTIPGSGTLDECVTAGSYTVDDTKTRYILVYLTVDSTADADDQIRLSVTGINTDGTVVGGTGTTRTIEVNSIFFEDNMDPADPGWVRSGWDEGHMHEPLGLWHLSSGEEDCKTNMGGKPFYHSATTSWWYGRKLEDPFAPGTYNCFYYTHMPGNYLDPTHNMGELTTPDVDATTGSSLVLTFWHKIMTEPDPGAQVYDTGHVWLYDGSWHKLTAKPHDNSDNMWQKVIVNLSAYAGRHVKLEFRFDTIDEMNNAVYMGWFLDDLAVYGKSVAHDIHVNDNSAPPVVSPSGSSLNVKGRFNNIGTSGETNVNVYLEVNNGTVDTDTIASLPSGTYQEIWFTWNPTVAGENHWICVGADPVPSETIIWNNKDCVVTSVRDVPAHYVYVLRSEGTTLPMAQDTWNHLNTNWGTYGAEQVMIDYSSLDFSPITYADISGLSPKPDVLVISASGGWNQGVVPGGREFSDAETADITKYILEGHGLLLTGSVFNELIPNNNDLASLVGVKDQSYIKEWASSLNVDPGCTSDPLFNNVGSSFTVPFGRTMSSPDVSWGSGDLTTGHYCAKSSGNQSAAIVLNKGVYMFSFSSVRMPNSDIYQLLYNAMITAEYQVFDHDVKAENIAAPNFARVGYPTSVSADITNIGKNNENVDVKLLVNSVQQDITQIFLAATGGTQRVSLSYTPSAEGDDNVCMRADIIGFVDQDLTNNEVCKTVKARVNPPVQVFVLDSWGTDSAFQAPWNDLNTNWNLYGDTPLFIDYTTFNKENIQYQELVDMGADVLVISSSYTGQGENPVAQGFRFTLSELNAIKTYVQDGHGIIITGGSFDTGQLPTHAIELGPLMGIDGTEMFMTTYQVYDMVVQNPAQNHPLFVGIPDHYDTRNGTSLCPGIVFTGPEQWEALHLSGGAYEALHDSVTPFGAVIANEPGDYNAVYISNWVERSAGPYDKQILYNAMVWGRSSVKGPSDLWIELWNGDADLRLTWTENLSPNLQGYNIYRANAVDAFTFGSPDVTLLPGTTEWVDGGTGIGNANNYYYIVRAFDDKGNEEQNRNIVGKFIITLYRGNNEISIPFELKVTNTNQVFSQLGNDYEKIYAFDALTGMWKDWDGMGGLLADVDHKMGLRVEMKNSAPQATAFVTVGRVPGMTDIDMYHNLASSYWNFVGFPRHLDTPLPQALDNYGMMGMYDLVYWYDPLDKKAHWKWFDPADPGGSPLTELRPGMGIWVHTTQAGTWSVPGS